MKKIIFVILGLAVFVGPCLAAIDIPDMHAGIYWSPKEEGVNHMETLEIVKFWDILSIEGGYAGDRNESDHKAIIALSLDIKQLKLGNYIKIPILDLIEFRPAVVAGLGHLNFQNLESAKADWGIGASFISVKF
jgi:hypothetical protein